MCSCRPRKWVTAESPELEHNCLGHLIQTTSVCWMSCNQCMVAFLKARWRGGLPPESASPPLEMQNNTFLETQQAQIPIWYYAMMLWWGKIFVDKAQAFCLHAEAICYGTSACEGNQYELTRPLRSEHILLEVEGHKCNHLAMVCLVPLTNCKQKSQFGHETGECTCEKENIGTLQC